MTVLLIDDEEVAVNALRRRVPWEQYGIDQVCIAHSMPEAQQIFQKQTIDIMLCDMEMPQGNGLDLYAWVKLHYPAVECVYVTCHPEFEYIQGALRLGSADYILKPIDYAELGEVLQRLTERMRRERHVEHIPAHILEKLELEEREQSDGDPVGVMIRYIHSHIQEPISLADLAGQVYLSESYVTRQFRKVTGMSVLEYITQERLRLAKELLQETTYPINRVADAVGYNNYSYFTRVFKRSFGMSPQAWRQAHGSK